MRKLFLLLLVPFLMATQCEDEFDNSGFETVYLLQNDSSLELFQLTDAGVFIEIESQSVKNIGSVLNATTSSIVPSASYVFSNIKLYKMDHNDFIQVYEQSPINDDLWLFNEPSVNRFQYSLIITDETLN